MIPASRGMSRSACCKTRPHISILAAALLCFVHPVAAYAQTGKTAQAVRSFDIPAQPLAAALSEFARQSGKELLFTPEIAAGKTSQGVSGAMPPLQALRRLLGNVGIDVSTTANGAILLRDVGGPKASSASDNRPTPQEQIEPAADTEDDRRDLPRSIAPATSSRVTEMNTMTVTGSHIRRAEQEGPLPVVSISREDIDRSGASTVREVLNALPQNAVAHDESGRATFAGASRIQLRGLSPKATLVLLNGRRVTPTASQAGAAAVDLNTIPLAAVDRIEVLTGPASAIYGADAVAGAVNIILKKDFQGTSINARYGSSYRGDATEKEMSLAIGGYGERHSGLIVLSAFDRGRVATSDRPLTESNDFTRFGGIDRRSSFSYPANVYSLNGQPLPGLQSTFAGTPSGTDGTGLTPADFLATDGVLSRFDAAPYGTLIPDSKRIGVYATGETLLGDAFTTYAELIYSRMEQTIELSPGVLSGGVVGLYRVPAGNPFNPFGVDVGVDYSVIEAGPQTLDNTLSFARAVVGVRGSLAERFEWDTYLVANHDNGTTLYRNFLDAARVREFLASTDPAVALNVFSTTGNNAPSTLAAIRRNDVLDAFESKTTMAEAVVRGPLARLPAGELQGALGIMAQRERVDFRNQFANSVFEGDREVSSVFGELLVPIVSPDSRLSGVHELELSLAARTDRYKDIATETSPQVGLVWRPSPALMLRASYGFAFTVPPLYELFAPRTEATVVVTDPAYGGASVAVTRITGGNPAVVPEDGKARIVGFIWEPAFARDFSIGVDLFDIELENFVARSLTADYLLQNPNAFPGRVVRAPPTPEELQQGLPGRLLSVDLTTANFGRVAVAGADLLVRHRFETGAGRFSWQFNGTYTDKYEIVTQPGTQAVNTVGTASGTAPVRFKAASSLFWERDTWFAGGAVRYQHSYRDSSQRKLSALVMLDAQLGYRFELARDERPAKLEIVLGAVNLANEQGRYADAFSAGYDPSRSDMRGRFYYLQARIDL